MLALECHSKFAFVPFDLIVIAYLFWLCFGLPKLNHFISYDTDLMKDLEKSPELSVVSLGNPTILLGARSSS